MRRERFELALHHLRPAQWERFEQLASEFLVAEFPNIRTTARPGDGGIDAHLFFPDEDDVSVVMQYSVQADWKGKIRSAVAALRNTAPKASLLVYVTNQKVAGRESELAVELRKDFGIHLDVRDLTWFGERVNTFREREASAEALAHDILDPLFSEFGVVEPKAPALTTDEAKAACIQLSLQVEDDTREKGLTKLCFDAIVRSALRDTDSEHRISRQQVHERVREALPTQNDLRVEELVDQALKRLSKKFIRVWAKEDEFCLTHDERLRIDSRIEDEAIDEASFHTSIEEEFSLACEAFRVKLPEDSTKYLKCVRKVLEMHLWTRGESFVQSFKRGEIISPSEGAFVELIGGVHSEFGVARSELNHKVFEVLALTCERTLQEPSESVRLHVASIADAYTLYSFLQETPDVQSAVTKMFSGGEIWLDTTVVLPLFAEDLLLDPSSRLFTNMYRAARESDLELYITPGVLEEVESHMRRCLAFARAAHGAWNGRVPYLSQAFAATGRSRNAFAGWLELFRGQNRPLDDVADYLDSFFDVRVGELETPALKAPQALSAAVGEIWQESHEKRRGASGGFTDNLTKTRLVKHDVENYLGVVGLRRDATTHPFGYRSWLLTMDRTAFKVRSKLSDWVDAELIPSSPVMSPDFMLTYLSIGPMRSRLATSSIVNMPLSVTHVSTLEFLPPELLDLADQLRDKNADLPEHQIRREVRDMLDDARRRIGDVSAQGLDQVITDIKSDYVELES